ncbi:MAG TPA: hypothetical protein VJ890_06010, partial [Vineibacter sp.]|nr:hypothetical protein [Vineibacter sp.]
MPASPPADAIAELALLDAADRNRRRAEWRVIWAIASAAAIASFFFGASLSPNPDLAWLSGVQGAVNALMVSVAIGWLEVAGGRFRSLRFMRAWPLWAMFLAKVLLYAVLIVASTQLARLLFYPVNPQPFGLNRIFLEILLFSSAVSLAANVTVEIGQLLGFRELGRLLTGRYLKPRPERSVFL